MPLCVDLYCGLGGWAEGFLAEGYTVIGFDIERHDYGTGGYPGQLVLQDVRTLHGSQLRDATVIVASPPCTEPSYRAMPWKRAKALNAIGPPHEFIELFETCFRIQREASEAADRHIPLIVENVRGAQPWVGRSAWHFGSYHLWGDVPALMPMTRAFKSHGMNWSDREKRGQGFARIAGRQSTEGNKGVPHAPTGHWTNPAENGNGVKGGFTPNGEPLGKNTLGRKRGSKSKARKAASAQIAKIPFPLAVHIARCFKMNVNELKAEACTA